MLEDGSVGHYSLPCALFGTIGHCWAFLGAGVQCWALLGSHGGSHAFADLAECCMLPSPPLPTPTGMPFRARWHVLEADETPVPACFNPACPSKERVWWNGIIGYLAPLLECCQPSLNTTHLTNGTRPGPHPNASHRGQLHTHCCLLTSKATLNSTPTFKTRSNRGGQGPSSHYVKIRRGSIMGNTKELYLHSLLCHMYHGPPPESMVNPDVHHRCHHSCCILPWHLQWVSRSANVLKGNKRRRQEDYAPQPLA